MSQYRRTREKAALNNSQETGAALARREAGEWQGTHGIAGEGESAEESEEEEGTIKICFLSSAASQAKNATQSSNREKLKEREKKTERKDTLCHEQQHNTYNTTDHREDDVESEVEDEDASRADDMRNTGSEASEGAGGAVCSFIRPESENEKEDDEDERDGEDENEDEEEHEKKEEEEEVQTENRESESSICRRYFNMQERNCEKGADGGR